MKQTISNTAEKVAQRVEPLLRTLVMLDSIAAVVCFGSYASGTADAESDIDLYVSENGPAMACPSDCT